MGHVILLHPHHGRKRVNENILPLGILYVAAPLVAQGYQVTCIDQRTEPDWRARVRRAIQEPNTICVGISTMTGPQITHALNMAKFVRDLAPDLPLVWGGVHPSLLPEQTIQHDLVDILALGEGEASFPPLVTALEKGEDWKQLPGVCYLEDGKAVQTPLPAVPDLEEIPPLPYDLFDLERYKISPLRSAGPSLPMVTSRGCRFRCAYCYIAQFQQRKWRGLSPESVYAEMKHLVDDYNAEGIFLLDDYFFQEKKRSEGIMRLLAESELNLNIYNANCRIDMLHRVDMEFLHLMRRSGIQQLFIGVESGSAQVLKDMLKDIKVEHVRTVNQKLKDADIIPVYSFMVGLPGETEADVEKTLDLMVMLKQENPAAKLYKLALFVPFPGTEYFNRVKEMGNAFPDNLEEWGDFDYDHVNLSYLTQKSRAYLEKVSELSAFVDVDGKIDGMLAPVSRLYSKIAVHRIRRRSFNFVPEMSLIKFARGFYQV